MSGELAVPLDVSADLDARRGDVLLECLLGAGHHLHSTQMGDHIFQVGAGSGENVSSRCGLRVECHRVFLECG
jgi:hypothetical protein